MLTVMIIRTMLTIKAIVSVYVLMRKQFVNQDDDVWLP